MGKSVISIDLVSNDQANHNIILSPQDTWEHQNSTVVSQLKTILGGDLVSAIVCVAGGWAGGNIASDGFFFSLIRLFL